MRKILHVIPLVSAVFALTSFLSVRREPAPDSDGHVLTPLWKEYAKASGKPFLAYEGEEDRVDRYTEFYRSLLGEDDD